MSTRLVVFVHGWGASQEDWWGATKISLTSHPLASASRFHFHSFKTAKAPSLKFGARAWQLITGATATESIGELGLGQTLWATLGHESSRVGATEIAIFGHSFGGIVIADTIRHALDREAAYAADRSLLASIRHIALCASPIDGAQLAETYLQAATPFGTNGHVVNLLNRNRERQDAVAALVNFLKRPEAPSLTLFYAVGDTVVQRPEAFAPFDRAGVTYRESALDGGHSDCIQNLSPASQNYGNYERLATWLFPAPKAAAPPGPPNRAEAIRLRQSFDTLLARLERTLKEDPFRAWEDIRASSTVKGSYLFRVFLQQLIFVASRMNSHALGSANLWVAHPAGDALHLRSDEREGYFATRQLITVAAASVDFRANRVRDKPQHFDSNSAGARAYLRDEPTLVAADKSEFPSEQDELTGVTHILGVPLCRKKDFDSVHPDQRKGLPLVITVDFCFDGEPSEEDSRKLVEAGRKITQLFRSFLEQWPADEARVLS